MQNVNSTPLLLQVLYEYKKNNETAMERFGEFLTSSALEKHLYDFSTFEIDNDLETNKVQQVTLQACYNSKYLTSKTGVFCVLASTIYFFAVENGSYRCWKVCDIDNNGYAVKSGQPIDTLETGTVNDLRSHYFGVVDQTTPYELPIASASTLGGIKVGNNLTIDSTTGIMNALGGGSNVASADFDSTKTQLNGLTIDGTIYKFLDVKVNDGSNLIIGANRAITSGTTNAIATGNCDSSTASSGFSTASGYSSTASGLGSTANGSRSTASGGFSTASGFGSTASSSFSTASGHSSTASGLGSTANGYSSTASGDFSTTNGSSSTASGSNSTASGYSSTATISYEWSILSSSHTATSSNDHVFTCYDISHIFFANTDFANETGWKDYTSFSQFTKGHYLKEYLGCGEVTTVTETMANIIANTSDYFDTTGTGTSADPYIVTPKTLDSQPHAGRLYKIALTATGSYITFQSSNNEKCIVEFTGDTSSTDILAFKNISGKARHGVNFLGGASGYTLNIPINTAFVADIDINSPDMWQLSD